MALAFLAPNMLQEELLWSSEMRETTRPLAVVVVWTDRIPFIVEVRDLSRPPFSLAARTQLHFYIVGSPVRVRPDGFSIPVRLRLEVLQRDGRCRDCLGKGDLVHHIRYRKRTQSEDLVLLCRGCHFARHDAPEDLIKSAAEGAYGRGESEARIQMPESITSETPWPPVGMSKA